MREFTLDGSLVDSRQTLHEMLSEGLDFPDWYGGNLDALYDCLTDLDETTLTLTNTDALGLALGSYWGRVMNVLRDCATGSDKFHLTIGRSFR